ncbi:hypothetical protein A2U01_0057000 [Trifolium medium]|uniref:Uncharacterized protein n=1 Tax=Trifolium medium TaxID=97028 RepID=A0A392RHQ1_9FABA|nr:hypothetical protein [Trifolium medium]
MVWVIEFIPRWKWGNNLVDFVRACQEGNNFIWIRSGQLVSKLHEILEVEEKMSVKYHSWIIGNKEVVVGKRVENEYWKDAWK